MIKNTRGYHDYIKQLNTISSGETVLQVNIANIAESEKHDKLYLDMFFLDTPSPENGHTWGVTLSTNHNYENYIALCELIPNDKNGFNVVHAHNVKGLTMKFVPRQNGVNFIIFKRN